MPRPRLTRRAFLARTAAALAATQLRTALALPTPAHPGVPGQRAGWGNAPPQPSPLGAVHLHPASDLAHRTAQNFARLQDPIYRPPLVFRQTNWQSWPGDFEGRALLALTLLARATGHTPDDLATLPATYRKHLNPQGYFGPPLDLHAINEQQLSGHGWYLRALCEYHDYASDPATSNPDERTQTLAQISTIIQNLALPVRGAYAQYPIDPAVRATAAAPANPGSVDGHLAAQHGIWAVSSDTGCAFIFLDGLTHAWVTLRAANSPLAPPLKSLIDESIARFTATDLVAIKAQTHASLTALRALMRVYENTPPDSPEAAALLATITDRYHLYRTSAMTEHYANTNWFGRPDSWTEPCAIIDSFILATGLWQHTANPAFLEDAHRIWFNGIGRGLRANGGFGTDTCPGATPFVHVRSYEAYFCCTMRGGEAHARAAQYLYFTHPTDHGTEGVSFQPERSRVEKPASVVATTLTIPFFENSTTSLQPLTGHTLTLRQTTNYPYTGTVALEFLEPPSENSQEGRHSGAPLKNLRIPSPPLTLRLFAPSWTSNHRLTLNHHPIPHTFENGFLTVHLTPRPNDTLTLTQTLRVAPRDPISSYTPAGSYVFEAGPLILAHQPAPNPAQDPAATLRSPNPTPIPLPRTARLEPIPAPTTTEPATAAPTPIAYRIAGTDLTLSPINDLNTTPDPTTTHPHPRQILFRPT